LLVSGFPVFFIAQRAEAAEPEVFELIYLLHEHNCSAITG
jgi:hypothetical protein